jgi:hypothetical protein
VPIMIWRAGPTHSSWLGPYLLQNMCKRAPSYSFFSREKGGHPQRHKRISFPLRPPPESLEERARKFNCTLEGGSSLDGIPTSIPGACVPQEGLTVSPSASPGPPPLLPALRVRAADYAHAGDPPVPGPRGARLDARRFIPSARGRPSCQGCAP